MQHYSFIHSASSVTVYPQCGGESGDYPRNTIEGTPVPRGAPCKHTDSVTAWGNLE